MTSWTVTEARSSFAEILERVAVGEQVTLTRHGVAVAVVVRPDILRNSRTATLYEGVDELRRLMETGRSASLSRGSMTVEQADDLVRSIRSDRDAF
ncbi:MAG: type II toxin-antitoxin system prevent-host-death family antitoxin [Nakamurella sp.]